MFAVLLLTVLGILIIWFATPLARYAAQKFPDESLEGVFAIGYRIGGVSLFLIAAFMFLSLIGILKLH
jgi:hypothetical protein